MPAYPPALGLLPPFSTPGASTSALPPSAPAPSPAPQAARGLCFCGAAVDAADALADDASCVSDDDDEAAIYCSRACARADALHALLSGGSSSAADMLPSLSSDSTSTVSTVGPRTPPRLASLPREPAAPRADADAARRASKARVLACASKQLQGQYPHLNLGLDSAGHVRLSGVAAETPASDDEAMAASLSLRLGMLGGSHYRRIQALRPVFEFNDDGADSPSSSSTSSGSYVAAPSHASPEREQARLAALNAPAQARARHARKDAMAAEALSSALSPPDSGFATALPSPATRASYLHHAHSRSDASSSAASDASASGNSLFSDDAGNVSCRSRATTMSTSERPPMIKGLFCTNPDRSSRSDLPIPPAPAPTSRELDIRAELAALDAELDSTFEAFEFWAEEHPHGDIEKWTSGLETDADGNLLGLALGAMGPLCSTPMPSCAQFASQSALFGGADDMPTTLPLQCRRPSLAPLDIDASLSVDRSVFEPDSPLLTPPSSSARGVTAAFSSFWRRTTTVSPPCTPEDGQPFDFTQRKAAASPPSPTGREREQAERLAGRIDAVLRSRWSTVKGAFAPSSPPAAEGKASAGPSPTSRPSLVHKRSRALLAAIAA